MATPLVGLFVFTVSVYEVAGGGVVLELPPPPQAVNIEAKAMAVQNAALHCKNFIARLP